MKSLLTILLFSFVSFSSIGQTREELFGQQAPKGNQWVTRNGYTLLKEVYDDFERMQKAAAKDSINLFIVSAYRSFERQKTIWERKWNSAERSRMSPIERARDILKYSSMPATSRHHWGTDMDLNSVEPQYFQKGEGKRILAWLEEHAAEYNFFRPYTEGRTKGYASEPWHWSHRPTAERYLSIYLDNIKNSDITGFKGCETADSLKIIENWVKLD